MWYNTYQARQVNTTSLSISPLDSLIKCICLNPVILRSKLPARKQAHKITFRISQFPRIGTETDDSEKIEFDNNILSPLKHFEVIAK